jgi:hypothetical protein
MHVLPLRQWRATAWPKLHSGDGHIPASLNVAWFLTTYSCTSFATLEIHELRGAQFMSLAFSYAELDILKLYETNELFLWISQQPLSWSQFQSCADATGTAQMTLDGDSV